MMRLFDIPSSLLCVLALTCSLSLGRAAVLPPEEHLPRSEERTLVARQCSNPCGYYHQVCCGPNQLCCTDAHNRAQCGQAGACATAEASFTAEGDQGDWQYYTTTYVETDLNTITTTFSSLIPISTQNLVATTTLSMQCKFSLGEVPCGSMCCSAGQYCMTDINQCAAAGGGSSGYYSSLFTTTQVASVAVRPTSNTILTVTSTGSTTATVPFQAPVGTDGSILVDAQATTQGSSLSPGAIAGIVIGVIAGIILLILICICCCARGAIDGIVGLFGGNKKRRTETTYIEERHSHHGSRPAGRTWFGSRPARVDRTGKKKKTGGLGGAATVGAGLGTLWLLLGLKRKRDRRNDAKSDSSYSYYDDSYTSDSA
jgi:hypothetical protein